MTLVQCHGSLDPLVGRLARIQMEGYVNCHFSARASEFVAMGEIGGVHATPYHGPLQALCGAAPLIGHFASERPSPLQRIQTQHEPCCQTDYEE